MHGASQRGSSGAVLYPFTLHLSTYLVYELRRTADEKSVFCPSHTSLVPVSIRRRRIGRLKLADKEYDPGSQNRKHSIAHASSDCATTLFGPSRITCYNPSRGLLAISKPNIYVRSILFWCCCFTENRTAVISVPFCFFNWMHSTFYQFLSDI